MGFVSEITRLCKRIFDTKTASMRTNMPARVVSYDAATNLVKIQPCIQAVRSDDPDTSLVDIPQIGDIPVFQFGTGKIVITSAPAVGSYGLYVVSDRSISNWITQGGVVAPGGVERFDLRDGFFLHGIFPTVADGDNGKISPAIETDRVSIRLRDGTAEVSLLDNGNVEIKAGNVDVTASTQFDVNGNFTVDP